MTMLQTVLGSTAAERTLLFLQSYGNGYAGQIAKSFGLSTSQVLKQLTKFEDAGVLVSRPVGRARVYYWNERNPLVGDLRRFLQSSLDALPREDIDALFRDRRRPRRKGKPN